MDEVYANLDQSCTVPRRLMYLWCHCCMVLHGILTNTIYEGESQIKSIYQSLYEISLTRKSVHQKQILKDGNHDLFMYCTCFMFTIDIGVNNRACTSSLADPNFIESISNYEPEPRPYSSQWWILRIHVIISRIQFFAYNQNVPTKEEMQSNVRYKAWEAILHDLTEYERTLPQTLRPYSVTHKNPVFSFKNIHVTDESALLTNILYHSAFIWMYHLQPDLTPDELQQVPPLSLPHAYSILGLLINCEKPTLWMITFWTHKQACICLEDAEAREDAQELSRDHLTQKQPDHGTFNIYVKPVTWPVPHINTGFIPKDNKEEFASTFNNSLKNSIAPLENYLCLPTINTIAEVSTISKLLNSEDKLNEPKPSILTDSDEAFLLRYYIESIGPFMCTFSADDFNLQVISHLALKERMVLDTICFISSVILCFETPGFITKETIVFYHEKAMKQINETIDMTKNYNRKLLSTWCTMLILHFDLISVSNLAGQNKIREVYRQLHEIIQLRSEYIKKQAHELGKGSEDSGPQDIFIPCLCLIFAMDVSYSHRTGNVGCFEPGYFRSLIDFENQPRMYSLNWWSTNLLNLLLEMQCFIHDQNVPTQKEVIENARFKRWKKLFNILKEFETNFPQSLKPYAVVSRYGSSGFPNVFTVNEHLLVPNVFYHASWITLLHCRPNMTEDEINAVPPGCLDHAINIIGLLRNCESTTIWFISYWTHMTASMCLEDPDHRNEAIDFSRQYEWMTGCLFHLRWEFVKKRWTQIDSYKKRKARPK